MKRKLKLIAHKVSEGVLAITGVRILTLLAKRYVVTLAGAYAVPAMITAFGVSTLIYFRTEGAAA